MELAEGGGAGGQLDDRADGGVSEGQAEDGAVEGEGEVGEERDYGLLVRGHGAVLGTSVVVAWCGVPSRPHVSGARW